MSHPIGTLLTGHGRHFLVTGANECRECRGPWATSFMDCRPWMTPVPVPPNVVTTDTVPDWATDCPVGI